MNRFLFVLIFLTTVSASAFACDVFDPQGRTRGRVESGVIYDQDGDVAGRNFSGEVYDEMRVHLGRVKNGVVYDLDRFVLARIVEKTAYNSNGAPLATAPDCANTDLGAATLVLFLQ